MKKIDNMRFMLPVQGSDFTILEKERKDLNFINSGLLLKIDSARVNYESLASNYHSLKTDHESLKKDHEYLKSDHEYLKHQIAILKQVIYGRKTEKADAKMIEQLSLIFNEAETGKEQEELDLISEVDIEDNEVTKKAGRKRGRKPLPKDLPRQQIIYDLTEEEKGCSCGCVLSKIGEERSEQLDYIPSKLQVIEHIRYKYACKSCEDTIRCASVPMKPLPKANASSGLLAQVLVSKFADHLPLYRQAEIFNRQGIDIPRNTLCNWVNACGDLLSPLIELLRGDIVASDYVSSDETPVNVLEQESGQAHMWVHMSGDRQKRAVVYDYQDSRKGKCASGFLQDFKGYHQCDAYSGYNVLHAKEGVTWVACWSHARRKFIEIIRVVKALGIAHRMVGYIRQLYKIEREGIDKGLDPGGIKILRAEKAVPVLTNIKQLLDDCHGSAPPQSYLGKAIAYTVNNWAGLQTYLENGRLRIDNNDGERIIKAFAVGRKNWLFCSTTRGAQASANIYSLIETCKANKVNVFDYFCYTLQNIRDCSTGQQLRQLLPYNIDTKLISKR